MSSTDIRRDTKNGDEPTNCGFGKYSPRWLQGLASKKIYVLVYGLLGMNQTAIGSYFIGTISTIERRYKFPSSATGLIASSRDFGALCTVLILAYFGAGGHKTRLVSICSIIAATSCYLRYLPYSLYGPKEKISLSSNFSLNLCSNSAEDKDDCSFNSEGFITWLILIGAQTALGIGSSTYNTLGAAYLDDNSLKDKTPFLLSVVTCLRHVGGLLGFLLASFTLHQNEIPDLIRPFDEKDRHWIGAWYLGWIPLGSVHLFFALLMAAFPKTLTQEAKRRLMQLTKDHDKGRSSSAGGLNATLKRLVKNPILMCNVLSATSYTFAIAGYWIFMPKYIETQFQRSASQASLITGTVGLVCTIMGTFLSGVVISRFKPSPRCLVGWSIFTKLVDLSVHIVFMFLHCSARGEYDVDTDLQRATPHLSDCATKCNCFDSYLPVCSINDQVMYLSPCHAGCTTASFFSNGQELFRNCSCVLGKDNFAMVGPCRMRQYEGNEGQFTAFIILLCLLKFLSYSSRAGNIIIQYRSVEAEDKSISIAVGEFMVCGLAFIPAPIIYGLLLDWSCLVWEDKCDGRKTNCILYNSQSLRYSINLVACGFFILAVLLDYGVFKNAHNLSVYEEVKLPTNITTEYPQTKLYSDGSEKKETHVCDICI